MKLSRRQMVASSLGAAVSTQAGAKPFKPIPASKALTLWYRKPAADWSEALPLGNGTLGAMVFGGPGSERIQINEQTLWGGSPHDYADGSKVEVLDQIRKDIFSGHLEAATATAQGFLGNPSLLCPYQPFIDLNLRFPGHEAPDAYRRELDIARAVHTVEYRIGSTRFRRECFTSFPDQVLVVRLTADKPKALSLEIDMTSKQPGSRFGKDSDGTWLLSGQIQPRQNPANSWTASWDQLGLKYAARLSVRHDGGTARDDESCLTIDGANEVILVFSGATSFKSFKDITGDAEALTRLIVGRAQHLSYATLLNAHRKDYATLFSRVELELGKSSPAAALPTDERLQSYKIQPDPGLDGLYFQYGRYLLISSSRAGGQPANLQGIWNDDLLPAWSSKWTTNINLQMNYWIAESGDLWETQVPLWDLIGDLIITGAQTARTFYGAKGWVLHHNTDLWRATTPVDGPWGIWPMGGVWLSNQMWDHYLFSEDRAFLVNSAYPAIKGAVEFALDFLVEAPSSSAAAGYLVTCPSISPENQYKFGDSSYHLTYAAPMDIELLRELFGNFLTAAHDLDRDGSLSATVRLALSRLQPVKVGARGQIKEWVEDYVESEPTHRHTSHLYGLYPGHSISLTETPDLAKAAARTLDLRGDSGTGWSMAWRTSLYARLGNGEHAHSLLRTLLTDFTQTNLLDVCPPFQIDGNFGGPAGISEMLLQSTSSSLTLLPALPAAWSDGEVKGLRARGGLKVDIRWQDKRIMRAVVHASKPRSLSIFDGQRQVALSLKAGRNVII